MAEERTVTIPAKAGNKVGQAIEFAKGRVFACIEATAEFKVRPDSRNKITSNTGRSFGDPASKPFKQLTFYNSSASDITVTYYAGDDEYRTDPSSVSANITTTAKEPSTYTKAHDDNQINDAATWTFNGLDGTKQRKQISICNDDDTGKLTIRDADNNKGHFLKPGQTVSWVTNGTIKVYNDSGATVAVAVMEIFYST